MSAILLVRHGQASFGQADYDRLSELGVQQATRLGETLRQRGLTPDLVVSGSMRRHRQTADACLAALQIEPTLVVDGDWDEYDHDQLIAVFDPRFADRAALAAELQASGDPARAFQRLFAAATARWVGGAHDADYAESWSAFGARVAAALARLATQLGRGRRALVFTSGGPIAAVAGSLLQLPAAQQIALGWTLANASLTKVLVGRDGNRLSTLNEHGHLEGPLPSLVTYR